jgi:hypothetical protein
LLAIHGAGNIGTSHRDSLRMHRQRAHNRPSSFQVQGGVDVLLPTAEEHSREDSADHVSPQPPHKNPVNGQHASSKRENERSSVASQHSRRSRKSEAGGTPSGSGKLRKPRPPSKSGEAELSVPRTRSKRQRLSKDGQLGNSSDLNEAQTKLDDVVQESKAKEGKLRQLLSFKPLLAEGSKKIQQASSHSSQATATLVASGTVQRFSRRIAGSEPVQKPIATALSRRVASRSLNLPTRGKARISKFHNPKDPMISVSSVEDLASLAALAHVIKNEDVAPSTLSLEKVAPTPGRISSPAAASPAGILRAGHFDTKLWSERNVTSGSPTRSAQPLRNVCVRSAKQNSASVSTSASSKVVEKSPFHQLSKQSLRPLNRTVKTAADHQSLVKGLNSPRPSVKALAARFNSGMVSQSETIKTPPGKLDFKGRARFTTSNDGLLASYTTNTPSPARSHKTPLTEKTAEAASSVIDGHLISTSLRTSPAKDALLGTDMSTERGSEVVQDSNPLKPITDLMIRGTPLPPTTTQENVIRTLDGHDSFESGFTEVKTRSSLSSLFMLYGSPSVAEQNVTKPNVHDDDTELLAAQDDYPMMSPVHSSGDTNATIAMVDPERGNTSSSSSANNISVEEASDADAYWEHATSLLVRKQILDMHKQLMENDEEIRHLKQQLSAQEPIEVDSLRKQLRSRLRYSQTDLQNLVP